MRTNAVNFWLHSVVGDKYEISVSVDVLALAEGIVASLGRD